ncbi:MAG: hypothetical protein LBQ79_03330 [Deltaproteobacteria bacterium]|jgi:hypothetical protein|nr:hypothetical protein [Deltaproteobacteria bacterium]
MPFKLLFAVLCLTAAAAFSQAAVAQTATPGEPGTGAASAPADPSGDPGTGAASAPADFSGDPETGGASDQADLAAEPGTRGASDPEGNPEGWRYIMGGKIRS